MTLIDPGLLELGLALTALLLVGLWSHDRRRRRLAEFLGGRRAVHRLSRWNLYRPRLERVLLLGLGGLALALAAAEPRWTLVPGPAPPVKSMIIAIDVSASMQATDVEPTRLAGAVAIADELLTAMEGHRVGLLLFAGTGYPLAPPTYDHDAIRFLLGGVAPTVASQYDPGTLVSVGIEEAVALLERPIVAGAEDAGRPGARLIVVIGDGDTGADDERTSEVLEAAAEANVTVHAVGVGTDEGSPMIMPAGTYQVGGPVLDAGGARAIARLDESRLRDLASAGGGTYAHVDRAAELQALREILQDPGEDPVAAEAAAPPLWTDLDPAFVLGLAALLLVLMESFLDVALPRVRTFKVKELA